MSLGAKDVIWRFLNRRNELQGTGYVVTRWPDEENRTTREVDAIAESDGHQALAIEHTLVMTFQAQVREDHWFSTSMAPIERELAHRYDPLQVRLVFNYVRGVNWPQGAVETVRNWLDANLASLPVDDTNKVSPDTEIPGIGFVRIYKRDKTPRPGLQVARTVPTNVSFADEGLEIMDKALNHKYAELAEYRKNGHRSILLLDNRDIALTNQTEQYKLYVRSCRANPRDGLNEVWVADVWEGAKEDWVAFYGFRGDSALMKTANPDSFWFGSEYDTYWHKVLKEEDERQDPDALN